MRLAAIFFAATALTALPAAAIEIKVSCPAHDSAHAGTSLSETVLRHVPTGRVQQSWTPQDLAAAKQGVYMECRYGEDQSASSLFLHIPAPVIRDEREENGSLVLDSPDGNYSIRQFRHEPVTLKTELVPGFTLGDVGDRGVDKRGPYVYDHVRFMRDNIRHSLVGFIDQKRMGDFYAVRHDKDFYGSVWYDDIKSIEEIRLWSEWTSQEIADFQRAAMERFGFDPVPDPQAEGELIWPSADGIAELHYRPAHRPFVSASLILKHKGKPWISILPQPNSQTSAPKD